VITIAKAYDTIYVGSQKPVMVYIPPSLMALNEYGEVIIAARGRAISRAVDVAEVLRNRFADVSVQSIDIGTQEMDEGRKISTISITLA